ncbi:MAG TPA: hypothetical protein VMS86_14005 [Thermoanaerobaculia bacterium]|nr:hypothetical protein [Thermoanaerobaculia bacterium]
MPSSDSSGAPPGRDATSSGVPEPAAGDRRRDAAVARILGVFFLALAAPVVAGIWFATLPIDRLLNVAAALVLAIAGGSFLAWSTRMARL